MRLPGSKDPKVSSGADMPRAVPSLARFWLTAFLGVALALLLAAVLVGYAWLSHGEAVAERELSVHADAIVRQAADRIATVQRLLRDWVKDPDLRRALRSRDEAGVRAKEETMARQIPETMGIHVVSPNPAGILDDRGSFKSDAAIDLINRALQGRDILPLEAHRVAYPDMHLAIAAPVPDDEGSNALGVVHVALPWSMLPAVADAGGNAGRILYQQVVGDDAVSLVQGKAGGVPTAAPARSVPIPATSLRVAVWPRSPGLFDGGLLPWASIGYLGVLALAALALWLPYRGLARALAEDQKGLIDLVEAGVKRRPMYRAKGHLAETEAVREAVLGLLGLLGVSPASEPGAEEPLPPLDVPAPASDGEGFDDTMAPAADAGRIEQEPRSAAAGPTGGLPAGGAGAARSGIFRAYDIRGVVGRDIDEAVMRDIGHAVGSEAAALGDRTVIVARDTRATSAAMSTALIAGLRASGRDVLDLGVAPTPLMYFATRYRGDASGVMITASHNPSEYNGCKIVFRGRSIEGGEMRAIADRIERRDLPERPAGGYREQDLAPAYIEHVERDVTLARGLKVVIDCGSGAAAGLAPALYRALGCDVLELHCDEDGSFAEDVVSDPSQPDNLGALSQAVTSSGADLGLGLDGDGDRLGVVDSDGRFIAADRVLMLFAADVLSRYPGTDVVFDVKCSHLLGAEILRYGGRPIMWQSGHSRIKAKLRETGGLLGGELSGHIVFQERWFGFDDATYAGARLLELLALDPRRTAEVFAALPDALGTPELLLPLDDGEPQRIVAQILALASRLEGVNVNTVDGLRAEFSGGWGLARVSNTQSALSFRFQGNDQKSLDMIEGLFRRLMDRVAPDLQLPF